MKSLFATVALTPTAPFLETDWASVYESLDHSGYARLPFLLTPEACAGLRDLYAKPIYRKTVNMARHSFGLGEYKYFHYPLPDEVQALREGLYTGLQPLANDWVVKLGEPANYPESYSDFLAQCAAAGMSLPTPLILRYGPGGHNTLHQDLYGPVAFPFQLVIALSETGNDYGGGELVLTEQRPRAQSVAQVVSPQLGEGIIFTNRYRPVSGSRGYYRVNVRHGISRVTWGERYALGIILHDAIN